MTREQLEALIESVESLSTNLVSHHHGPQHWRCVSRLGIELARETPGADPLVALLFGLFHDAMRENEFDDPEHGPRAAKLLKALHGVGLIPLSSTQMAKVSIACITHTESPPTPDPMVGVCYDADRLTLWRVGIRPSVEYLSTRGGARRAEDGSTESLHRTPLTWREILDDYFRTATSAAEIS